MQNPVGYYFLGVIASFFQPYSQTNDHFAIEEIVANKSTDCSELLSSSQQSLLAR